MCETMRMEYRSRADGEQKEARKAVPSISLSNLPILPIFSLLNLSKAESLTPPPPPVTYQTPDTVSKSVPFHRPCLFVTVSPSRSLIHRGTTLTFRGATDFLLVLEGLRE